MESSSNSCWRRSQIYESLMIILTLNRVNNAVNSHAAANRYFSPTHFVGSTCTTRPFFKKTFHGGRDRKNDSRIGRKQRSVCPTSKFRLRDPLSYSLRWTQESLRRNLFGHFQANGGVKRQHQNRFHVLGGRVANLFGQEIQRGPPSRSIFVSMQSLWSPLTNCLKLIVHG